MGAGGGPPELRPVASFCDSRRNPRLISRKLQLQPPGAALKRVEKKFPFALASGRSRGAGPSSGARCKSAITFDTLGHFWKPLAGRLVAVTLRAKRPTVAGLKTRLALTAALRTLCAHDYWSIQNSLCKYHNELDKQVQELSLCSATLPQPLRLLSHLCQAMVIDATSMADGPQPGVHPSSKRKNLIVGASNRGR